MSERSRPIPAFGAVGPFLRTGTCSQALFTTLNRAYGHPLPSEERASAPLAGGLLMQGYQCGQIWGAALAAGAQAHRVFGPGHEAHAKAIQASRRVIDAFLTRSRHTDCFDIIDIPSKPSKKAILKALVNGTYGRCMRLAARYPRPAMREIDAALSEKPADVGPGPVSCAALLAQRMGASAAQAVMAAGLAGGIGLSGGACGALATAVWLTTLERLEGSDGKIGFHDPNAAGLLDRFLKCTNYELECSAIVGRTFDGVADHAQYLHAGGCAKILDVLAAG